MLSVRLPTVLSLKNVLLSTPTAFAGCVFTALVSVFSARYLHNDAARITKLDIQMFHDE